MAVFYPGVYGDEIFISSASGKPYPPGTPYRVYEVGTTTLATLYSNASRTAMANPAAVQDNGNVRFWADITDDNPDGAYDVSIGSGLPVRVYVSPYREENADVVALSARITALEGGVGTTDTTLKAWTQSRSFQMTARVYDSQSPTVVRTSPVLWPDGSTGTYLATTIDHTFNVTLAYKVTHIGAGKVIRQPLRTRNAAGEIVAEPALVITDIGITPIIATIQDLIDNYATIQDVIDTYPTIQDILEGV